MSQPLLPVPFLDELGFKVESAAEGRCRISVPVTSHIMNPYGVLHSGITFTLADTGMGILRPAKSGRIVAECRVIRRSNRFAITEAEVFDEASEVIAVAGGSFYISRSKT